MKIFEGYMKSIDLSGNIIFGNAVQLADRFYLEQEVNQFINDIWIGFSINYISVFPDRCAKMVAELPNGEYLFEYDVFETSTGECFYIIFDFVRMAIVYMSNENEILPDNLNLFKCTYIGNIKLDDNLLEKFN